MACFSPLPAWQLEGGEIVFAPKGSLGKFRPKESATAALERVKKFQEGYRGQLSGVRRELQLPCGGCVGCRLERSRQWAMRCLHESQMHEYNSFVTLTYDDKKLPLHGTLVYRHFQKFMRRMRWTFPNVRFYMCGEYGEEFKRPHYHACLFGVHFDDRVEFGTTGSGSKIYTSELLSALWGHGFCTIGDVTFESAAYVARYVMKKMTGDASKEFYLRVNEYGECFEVEPEFTRMSLKPGIGATWFEKYKSDVFPHDYVIINGRKVKPPKYYDELLTVLDEDSMSFIELDRYLKRSNIGDDMLPSRLRAREIVTRARLSFKKRSLE